MKNQQFNLVLIKERTSDNSKSNRGTFGKNRKQLEIVYSYLRQHTATATMISMATGIPQKNICRYKRKLEKAGLVYQAALEICEETGYLAWYLCAV